MCPFVLFLSKLIRTCDRAQGHSSVIMPTYVPRAQGHSLMIMLTYVPVRKAIPQ